MTKYSIVIFDLFATLTNGLVWLDYLQSVDDMAKMLGVPVPDFVYLFEQETRNDREIGIFSSIDENIEYVCNKLGIKVEENRIKQASRIRYDFTKRAMEPRTNAISVLHQIKEKGLNIGMVSNCAPDVPFLWRESPMAELIKEPVFSSDIGFKKPDARIYEYAIKKYMIQPSECLYIGDGASHELSGAKQIGMEAIRLQILGEEGTDIIRPGVESWQGQVINDLSQTIELLSSNHH